MLDLHCLARDTSRLGRVGDMIQHLGGILLVSSACCAKASDICRTLDSRTSKTLNGASTISAVTLAPTDLASDNPCETPFPRVPSHRLRSGYADTYVAPCLPNLLIRRNWGPWGCRGTEFI